MMNGSQMFELDAGLFLNDYAAVARAHDEILKPLSREEKQSWMNNITNLQTKCETMGMGASVTQARRIMVLWNQSSFNANNTPTMISNAIKELLSRVRDEAFGICFYHVNRDKGQVLTQDEQGMQMYPNQARLQRNVEFFGQAVCSRFPAIREDLLQAIRSYAFECNTACVFHLMRATEITIPKIAKLCQIKDPKPSWGTVLDQAEKLTQRTKHEDLPSTTKPHIELLRMIVGDMRS